MKRPNSAVKQQRKESPGLQHRGAGPGGRGQANLKPDRPGFRDARGTKAKDDKVRLQQVTGWIDGWLKKIQNQSLKNTSFCFYYLFILNQGKKGVGDTSGDAEQKKFDGTGYDSDLVDSLERDIVSRNPNVHWYGSMQYAHSYFIRFAAGEVFFLALLTEVSG